MRKIKHALSGAIYEFDDDWNVLVTTRDGRSGHFDHEGRWLSGELRACDPTMCMWVGNGPHEAIDLTQNRRFRLAPDAPPTSS